MISNDNRHSKVAAEMVYYNNGEVYKAPTNNDLQTNYVRDTAASNIFPFSKKDGKKYYWSEEFTKAYFSSSNYVDGSNAADFSGLDICPSILHLDALGIYDLKDKGNCDMFFNVDSLSMLEEVSTYYGLPYPISKEQRAYLNDKLEYFSFLTLPTREFIIGAVKFIDGVPSILKLYLYPKHYGKWNIWMNLESVHNNGAVLESGVSLRKNTGGNKLRNFNSKNSGGTGSAELLYSTYEDKEIVYNLNFDNDNTLHWTGLVINDALDIVDTRNFRSTALGRILKFDMHSKKTEFEDTIPTKLDGTIGWIGYSWFDSTPNVFECYFPLVGGYDTLKNIAGTYNLTVPCSVEEANDMLGIRASHYSIPGFTKELPVAVCSVVFDKDGAPIDLILYKFKRRLEYAEPLPVPDVVSILDRLESTGKTLF
jgi:hypothetical protein